MKNILFVFLLLIQFFVFSQSESVKDSLQKVIKSTGNDSVKVMSLQALFGINQQEYELEACKKNAEEAIAIAEKSKLKSLLGVSNLMAGIYHKETEDYPKAQNHLSIALLNLHPLNNKKLLGDAFSYMGFIQERMGMFKRAIDYHRSALKIRAEIAEKMTAVSFMRIAGCFSELGLNDSAYFCFYKAMAIAQKYDSQKTLSGVYNNLGMAYDKVNQLDSALSYYIKGLAILSQFSDSIGMAGSLINIGSVYSNQKKYEKAIEYYKRGVDMALKMKFKSWIANGSRDLADVYYVTKDYKLAFEYLKLSRQYQDSVLNEGKLAEIANAEEKYQSEKKQQELEMADLKIKSQEDKLSAGETIRNILITGLVIILIAGVYVFYAYSQKNKLSKELSFKNKEIENQKAMIEERNKDITDSIEYAKRIQRSQFPSEYAIKRDLERLNKN